ncbi:MAG TPA: NfeD family protein [Pseudomonadales bacterium]|nr:NfeD family protein [Pseudomonadales bacterium]
MIIYAICLVTGLLFTVVTVMFGHFFGGSGHVLGSGGHVEAGADASDDPGMSIFSPTVIASFITAFGGFGLVFSQFPTTKPAIISAPLAIFGGVVVAGVMYFFFSTVFRHTQSSSESRVTRLVNTEATIITPISENGVGEIAYVVGGTRYTAPARAEDSVAISNGQTVKIVRVVGTQFYVKKIS